MRVIYFVDYLCFISLFHISYCVFTQSKWLDVVRTSISIYYKKVISKIDEIKGIIITHD